MKTMFEGHAEDGTKMGFMRMVWLRPTTMVGSRVGETHVCADYRAVLDVAVGVHGPFLEGADPYIEALVRALKRRVVFLPR
jgi:hypothetical protein